MHRQPSVFLRYLPHGGHSVWVLHRIGFKDGSNKTPMADRRDTRGKINIPSSFSREFLPTEERRKKASGQINQTNQSIGGSCGKTETEAKLHTRAKKHFQYYCCYNE